MASTPLTTHATDVEVAVIGTGFSGLGMAINLKQSGRDDFVVLEAADDLGGTWRDNHYPGCGCDVQSHLYSFSFEPNPNWSRLFAPQAEIWAYLRHCAEKYKVTGHIRYNNRVESAEWDEAGGFWHVRTNRGYWRAKSLVSGIGGLSRPSYPNIPGIENFRGKAFHSQQWDHDFDLTGKRVAVIGTGASAIQFVPQIAPEVAELQLFQRTPPWVVPKPDRAVTRLEQALFKRLPSAQLAVRNTLYWQLESRALAFVVQPRLMKLMERQARSHLRKQVPDRDLRKRLTPDYTLGCKRVLISDDYYPALTRDNVNLVTDGIREVREHSIITADGVEREVDAIIYGTGFAATDPIGPLKITGRDGADLRETFAETGTEAFLGTTVSGFPNLFLLMGPNTGLGHNSMVYMIESQIALVMDTLKAIDYEGLAAVDVKRASQDAYNRWVHEHTKEAVWNTGGCKSWYLDANGKNVTLWPGFTWDFRRRTRRFPARHFELLRAEDLAPAVVETQSADAA
ncbi:MAG: NAD(P)/FAD-dependent oxidoreductase [Salinisphaeraceae bacterium]